MKILFLIGFMGSGKSTMGKLIAKAMNWRFIDLDDYIEMKVGESIPSIFEREGEDGFRKMERVALEEVVRFEKVVVATGGGTPCFYENMRFMKLHGLTLYLKLLPQELWKRLLPVRSSRPLIANKSDEELLHYIEEKLSERELFYNQAHILADATTYNVASYIEMIDSYIHTS